MAHFKIHSLETSFPAMHLLFAKAGSAGNNVCNKVPRTLGKVGLIDPQIGELASGIPILSNATGHRGKRRQSAQYIESKK